MAKHASASAPARRRHAGDDPELIDWHAPAQNARVLDWRQRAEAFGLNPIADDGGTDGPVVLPAEQLIDEEEPEATAQLGFNDIEAVEPVPTRTTMSRPTRGCRSPTPIPSACTCRRSASAAC